MRSTDALARTTHVHMLRKNGDRPRMSRAVRESSEQQWWGSKHMSCLETGSAGAHRGPRRAIRLALVNPHT
jgi:hypothetical protein